VLAMMLQRFEITRRRLRPEDQGDPDLKPEGLYLPGAAPPAARAPRDAGGRGVEASRGARRPRPGHGTPLLVLYGSNTGCLRGFARRHRQRRRRPRLPGAGGGRSTTAPGSCRAPARRSHRQRVLQRRAAGQRPPILRLGWTGRGLVAVSGEIRGLRPAATGLGRDLPARAHPHRPGPCRPPGRSACSRAGRPTPAATSSAIFEAWYAPFLDTLARSLGVLARRWTAARCSASRSVPTTTTDLARQNRLQLATVVANRELVRHQRTRWRVPSATLEIALPAGMSYAPGELPGVCCRENNPPLVERVARRFGLRPDAAVVLRSSRGSMAASLPTDRPSVGAGAARLPRRAVRPRHPQGRRASGPRRTSAHRTASTWRRWRPIPSATGARCGRSGPA
jgi:cytochrome P450/NADPH-cytochrome P450 reductase